MASLTREQTVKLARSFKGIAENPPNSNKVMFSYWYGMIGAWCAMFVSYVLYHAGHPLPIRTRKGFAYVPDVVNWAQDNGRWFTNRYDAKPGDLVVYWFPSRTANRPNHVGIFAGLTSDGRVIAIEGNTGSSNRDGGSVQERYRNSYIHGFVRLDYPSSDPTPPPQPPELWESDMRFYFKYPESKRTFMSDGFHYREVSDSDRQIYSTVYKSQTGKDIGMINLVEEQVKRMVNVGP